MIASKSEPVVASVLVGSVNGGEWLHVLLDALERQTTSIPFEVIIADRCQDGTRERVLCEHPSVQVLEAPRRTTLPSLRTQALEQARGRVIVVTEDHTVPPPQWIERLVTALDAAPESIIAVGGLVDNGMRDNAINWAAFLCEYSGYLPPQISAEVDDVPGMNIAYRRAAFDGASPESLASGFWESTLHPRLLARGQRFYRLADLVISHRKHFDFFYFLSQRYHYSRHFAGTRFAPEQRARRFAYGALSLALPALVLARVARCTLPRRAHRKAALVSLPALSCFVVAWGAGELVGYTRGPGDSLLEIE